jgi:hypothetical protein
MSLKDGGREHDLHGFRRMTDAAETGSFLQRLLDRPLIRQSLDRIRPSQDFATFWHGPLDPITYTCLSSFPHHGVPLRLYCYEPPENVPAGLKLLDAREIIADAGMLHRYLVKGQPSISKFSNYFRYRMIRQTGACWVDSDILCLRKPDFSRSPVLFGVQIEHDGVPQFNGAVFRLPRRHPMLAELEARAGAGIDTDTKWGVLGPLLITELARKYGTDAQAQPNTVFYPVPPREFWKVLLPEYREEVVRISARSNFLHLWHELYKRANYNKGRAPAEGSFLYEACAKLGTLDLFLRPYKADALRTKFARRIQAAAAKEPTEEYDADEAG